MTIKKVRRATPVWRLAGGCIIEKAVTKAACLDGPFEQESTITDGYYVQYEGGGAEFIPEEMYLSIYGGRSSN